LQLQYFNTSCHLFSYQDIREAIWMMNTRKAADEEGFQVKIFKQGLHATDNHLVGLFNHVVYTGFPPSWSHHIIHPIRKSSSSMDPKNYRTIRLGHTFSKLYATVLHLKLFGELERQRRAKRQDGFCPGHQTIDHILTLKAIIEEAQHRSSKAYCCFVDFQKAFDFIPREALFQRLTDIDISDTILSAIMRL
jgi:hypothetical protein